MSEIKTIIFNIGDGSSENLREQYNTNFVGDYSELIEQIRQSDKKTVVRFIKYNNENQEETLISVKIDCRIPDGQFKLEGFVDKGGNFYVLDEYNYFHKDLQLLPLAEAVSFLSNRINNLDEPKQVARLENGNENKIKEEMGAIKKATDGGNGIIYTSGHEEVSRFVNSIIFSLCESARMEKCYVISNIINGYIYDTSYDISKRGESPMKQQYSIDGLSEYINNYSSCYEFIYGGELGSVANIEDRGVLSVEDFEVFLQYKKLFECFKSYEREKDEFRNLVNDCKLLSARSREELNFQERERVRNVNFETIQDNFKTECANLFSPEELNDIFTLGKKLVGNGHIKLKNEEKRKYLIIN